MGNKLCCAQNNMNQLIRGKETQMMTSEKVNNTNVSLILGRVFDEDVDAIVLVTNTKLKLGQNDAMNIRRFGGESIIKELNKILVQESGRLRVGEVVHTHGGDMDFDYILYAVLPSYCDSSMLIMPVSDNKDEDFRPPNSLKENMKHAQSVYQIYMNPVGNQTEKHEKQQIFECLVNCLNKAVELGIKSIAFPVLEPPSFRISKSLVAIIMIVAIKTFLKDNRTLNSIHLTIPDNSTLQLFKWALTQMVNDLNEQAFLTHNTEEDKHQSEQYWGIKSSLKESFQADTEDLMRFGHGYCTSLTKSTEVKRSL